MFIRHNVVFARTYIYIQSIIDTIMKVAVNTSKYKAEGVTIREYYTV